MDDINCENLNPEILNNWPDDSYDMLNYIRTHCNGWICKVSKQFSVDLEKFNIQWADGCVKLKIRPQKVLLVSSVFLPERIHGQFKVLSAIINKLTENGYIVIGMDNFDSCSECNEVIVSKKVMSSHNYSYSGKCQKCFPYNPKLSLN